MVDAGKHHNSASCHIATTLLTRIIACWRGREPYVLRDVGGSAVTAEQARAIIADRYAYPQTSARGAPPPRRERTGEARSRAALHQPARPNPTLRPPQQLDIG
jgi:hypothetical protein